jgi:acetylglutamate kinase
MIPKLENAFQAIEAGVQAVIITRSDDLEGKNGTRVQA